MLEIVASKVIVGKIYFVTLLESDKTLSERSCINAYLHILLQKHMMSDDIVFIMCS